MLACVNFLLLVCVLHLSVVNCMPGINRVKFGRITRFVSSLAASVKPQPSERCQLSLLFPAIFLACPLLRHVCIRFPATRVTNIHHCLLVDWSFSGVFLLLFLLYLLNQGVTLRGSFSFPGTHRSHSCNYIQ